MKKLAVAVLAILTPGFMGTVNAAAGDNTFSVGYAQINSGGLKKVFEPYRDFVHKTSGGVRGLASDDVKFSADAGKYKAPKGLNVKYRHEFDDRWGVIGSLTWARSASSAYIKLSDPVSDNFANTSASVKGHYFSVMAGPSYRVNDHISTYAMAGSAFARVKQNVSGAYNLSDYGLGSGSALYSQSKSKRSFAYSAGIQLNPVKNIAIDLAYEGSGSGDWKTNGFIAGVGYKF